MRGVARACALGWLLAGVVLAGCQVRTGSHEAPVAHVGFVAPASPAGTPYFDAFRDEMRALGYAEGRNVRYSHRAVGRDDDPVAVLQGLVDEQPDVLVASSWPLVRAAHAASAITPVVMITTADPRTDGTLASLRRPDANLSGLCQVVPLGSKQLELLKDAAPDLERVAVLWNSSKPAQAAEWTELQNSAAALGVSLHSLIVTRADELVPALADASAGGAQRLVVLNDFLFFSYRAEIIAAAAAQRLPAVYPNREYVAVGGLMSYGPSLFDMHRRAAWYVVRALNGAQLAELPVEGPAHFELALNLPAARAQEVTFPRALLRDASHIFE